jgi:hypothetical protein
MKTLEKLELPDDVDCVVFPKFPGNENGETLFILRKGDKYYGKSNQRMGQYSEEVILDWMKRLMIEFVEPNAYKVALFDSPEDVDKFFKIVLPVECTACKNGVQTITECFPFDDDREDEEFEIDCVVCDGVGRISEAEKKAIDEHQADWCKCKNIDGTVDFYDDGEHPKCSKHHYRHRKCGGIFQIG